MRISLVGTRGLPPNYGGYETFADHFVKNMVPLGHEVIVACERPMDRESMVEEYHGAKLVYFPTKPPKSYGLRKIYEGINDLYFYFRLAWSCDVMYILAGLGTQTLLLLRLIRPGLKIVTNNDGLEWKRSKYSWLERVLWKSFIRNSLRYSHLVVHDNPKLVEYFPKHRKSKSISIDYGVEVPPEYEWSAKSIADEFPENEQMKSLEPGNYHIVVARLQHDNNTHVILDGFLESDSDRFLLVIGGVWDSGYESHLEEIRSKPGGDRIIMPGGIYDLDLLNMLRRHAYSYIHGHSAGGTNPTLLEAMAMKRGVIAHDNPFNRHVLDGKGLFFNSEKELGIRINSFESNPDLVEDFGDSGLTRVMEKYVWSDSIAKHEKVFLKLLGK